MKLAEIAKRKGDPDRLERYLAKRPIPAILGPKTGIYLIDHHHLARAIWEADLSWAFVRLVHDYSCLSSQPFWARMLENGYVYNRDEQGRPLPLGRLPSHVGRLKADPYRDLATFVRRRGGFDKSERPFSEFSWAAYYRRRVSPQMLRSDMSAAVKLAMALSQAPEAAKLPGYKRLAA